MKIPINIVLDDDVYLSQEVKELRKNQKLSSHINMLLRSSFNIQKTIEAKNEEQISAELLKLDIKRGILEDKKKSIEEARMKEENKWRTIL